MKTVLITGVSRGIGKALAERFLEAGDLVIGTSTTGKADIENERLLVFSLDLSNPESIARCVERLTERGEKIDILINNAGALLDDEETEVTISKLRQTLEVNLIGTIDFTERMIPLLQRGAHIVNMSSSAGSLVNTRACFYPSYKISKVALNMYTRTLALRLGGAHIVSSVHPGWVRTDMGGDEADMSSEEAAEYIYQTAISRPESGQFWFKGEHFPW